MKKVLFPGTFDPPTLGHLDIISRASKLCDTLIIGVATSPTKHKELLTVAERIKLLKKILGDSPSIQVTSFDGLVADYAEVNQITLIIRGLRSNSDFEYESQLAFTNRSMKNVETLFLVANEKYSQISSTLVREIASYGGPLESFLPGEVVKFLSRNQP